MPDDLFEDFTSNACNTTGYSTSPRLAQDVAAVPKGIPYDHDVGVWAAPAGRQTNSDDTDAMMPTWGTLGDGDLDLPTFLDFGGIGTDSTECQYSRHPDIPNLPPDLSYLDMLHKQASDAAELKIVKQREEVKLAAVESAHRLEMMKIELERAKLRVTTERKTSL